MKPCLLPLHWIVLRWNPSYSNWLLPPLWQVPSTEPWKGIVIWLSLQPPHHHCNYSVMRMSPPSSVPVCHCTKQTWMLLPHILRPRIDPKPKIMRSSYSRDQWHWFIHHHTALPTALMRKLNHCTHQRHRSFPWSDVAFNRMCLHPLPCWWIVDCMLTPMYWPVMRSFYRPCTIIMTRTSLRWLP